jgi:hypothetical protein
MDGHAATAGRHRSGDIHAQAAAMLLMTGAWQCGLAGMHQRRLQAGCRFARGAT